MALSPPISEVNALYDLYQATDGENWAFRKNYSEFGIPWNFTNIKSQNPCSLVSPWQGVNCTTTTSGTGGNISTTISSLHLDEYNLTGIIPSSISNLTSLVDLELGYNHIYGGIPSELCLLETLEVLKLEFNHLKGNITS